MNKDLLRKKIEGARNLPTLSVVVAKVTEMIRNPRTTAAQVAVAISEDPALSARVLKMVNSSFYGFSQRVTTVSHAIVILGFNAVRSIVMAVSVFDALGKSGGSSKLEELWEHAITVAVAADAVAKEMGLKSEKEEAFVAGLLHDVGKVALAHVVPESVEAIWQRVEQEQGWVGQAEERVLGVSHPEVGAWLTESWKFPASLQAAVRLHHLPEQAQEHRKLVMVVHVADLVARVLNIGSGWDRTFPPCSSRAWKELGITEEKMEKCFASTVEGLSRAGTFFEMIHGKGKSASR
jgi:putative nucleotidyltransferase with HDIG domain